MFEVKMYREILCFIKNQRDVIKSFKVERKEYAENQSVNMLLNTLEENICIFKYKINNIIDGDDNDVDSD